jgi:hypothetical protein
MRRWRTTFLDETFKHLGLLGLESCPVCHTSSWSMAKWPSFGFSGDLLPSIDGTPTGPMVDLFVRVDCTTCSYVMLFDSERFRTDDEKILAVNMTEEEEADADQREPL